MAFLLALVVGVFLIYNTVTFSVITCEMVADMDREDVEDGFRIFDALARLQPDFHCMTGDNVYYDGEPPFANTPGPPCAK